MSWKPKVTNADLAEQQRDLMQLLKDGFAKVDEKNAEIRRLRALLSEAGEALWPFATAAGHYDPSDHDGDVSAFMTTPTIGQLRAARAALAKIKEATDGHR